jgi:hypothetical protein
LDEILAWIVENTTRTPFTVANNYFCRGSIKIYPISEIPLKQRFPVLAQRTFLLPHEAMIFFINKIREERYKKTK